MAAPDLVERWFELTRRTMPQQARQRRWPVHLDHCFQRILLDNAVGAKWTSVISAPAYRNASDATLEAAIGLGEQVMAQEADLHALNRRSLGWRGKLGGAGARKAGGTLSEGEEWLPELDSNQRPSD